MYMKIYISLEKNTILPYNQIIENFLTKVKYLTVEIGLYK